MIDCENDCPHNNIEIRYWGDEDAWFKIDLEKCGPCYEEQLCRAEAEIKMVDKRNRRFYKNYTHLMLRDMGLSTPIWENCKFYKLMFVNSKCPLDFGLENKQQCQRFNNNFGYWTIEECADCWREAIMGECND